MKITITSKFVLYVTSITISAFALSARAFDAEKERRIAEQTLETLFIGEPLWLNVERASDEKNQESKFLSVITEATNAKGVVVLIHGTGLGPDTPFVIGPIRELLSDSGYTTLALQMPVLSDDKGFTDYSLEFPESRRRISAAINYFKDNDKENLILLAHSLGSTMMMDWVDHNNTEELASLISLGLGTNNTKGKLTKSKLHIPLLDVVGENDYDNVLTAAKSRKENVLRTNKHSTQMVIQGLNHFYTDHEDRVVDVILDWLKKLD